MIPLILPHFDFEHGQISIEDWPDAFHHATRVRRVKAWTQLMIADGAGKSALCSITAIEKNVIHLELPQEITYVGQPRTTLWIATIDKAAMEEACHLASQTGIAAIRFVQTDFTNTVWQPKHTERLQKIILASCTQSEQKWIPQLETGTTPLTELPWQDGIWHIAIERTEDTGTTSEIRTGDHMHHILIGPEGGWSREERSFLYKKTANAAFRASILDLGSSILRAETAALISCWYVTRLQAGQTPLCCTAGLSHPTDAQ